MNDMTSALISTVVAAVACGSAAAVIIMSSPVRAEPANDNLLDHPVCACRFPPEDMLAHLPRDPVAEPFENKAETCSQHAVKPRCWFEPPLQISTTVLPTPTP